jgi:hemin uptake protein HemP
MLHPYPEPDLVSVEQKCLTSTSDLPEPPLPQWSSDELLGTGDEAHIVHRGDVYRLRRTLTGKLILTK